MHSYSSPQILPLKLRLILSLMGKESSFLPQKCKANLPHTGKESYFLPCMFKVHHSPGSASPQNATLPFPQREGFLPFQNTKSPQILPYKWFFFCIFICLFFFSLLFIFFFPFLTKTWNSSPKWKSYSPAFGANNRRIAAPGSRPTTSS